MSKEKMQCSLSNITLSTEPCKMIITGSITKIGVPSDGSPCGAQGKRTVFTQESINECAQTFVGMPLNCYLPDDWWGEPTDIFTDHGDTNIGYIRAIEQRGEDLMAEIVVWKENFWRESMLIMDAMDALGFSVEWFTTSKHEDDECVYIDKFEGAGCAILWQNRAAYKNTFIEKLAAKNNNRSDADMTEKEMKELVGKVADVVKASMDERLKTIEDAQMAMTKTLEGLNSAGDNSLSESINAIKETVDAIKAAQEENKATVEANKADIEAIKASMEQTADEDSDVGDEPNKASADEPTPAPKSGQQVVDNPLNGADDKAARLEKITASNMSLADKLKEITKVRMQG